MFMTQKDVEVECRECMTQAGMRKETVIGRSAEVSSDNTNIDVSVE